MNLNDSKSLSIHEEHLNSIFNISKGHNSKILEDDIYGEIDEVE